ncbi:MAG: DUF475 domain-containing protein [Zoogloeaceae bacterium]|jgi:hypothetical protein|nr:DUF475 domain-containing protein [Zoogloeaceae bacterium]
MKEFRLSFFVTLVCLALSAYWGETRGMGAGAAVLLAAALGVMEVSLSFDNAVVNASVLKTMAEKWQQIFLTVGILIAVFGMRLFFPIAIVAIATGLGMVEVGRMALEQPEIYSEHLAASHVGIAAFGGMFLWMVFLSFLFDRQKELHWLGALEKKCADWGRIESIGVLLALSTLFGLYLWLPVGEGVKLTLLGAGLGGVILFLAVRALDAFFVDEAAGEQTVRLVQRNGVTAFLYLEVLDTSFSFDGVIGAFAITRDVVLIMLGLAIGAMFVRSLTVHLVRKGTLDEYVFLEHGAHYAIGALALIMLAGMVAHVPEIVTGLIGVAFIGLALLSSLRHKKRQPG